MSYASGYGQGEPSECPPEVFRAWVQQACADHGLPVKELAACIGLDAKQIPNIYAGNHKVPRRIVRTMQHEGVPLPCSNPACRRLVAHRRRCPACRAYWTRHHAERPAWLCAQPIPRPRRTRCANPICPDPPSSHLIRCDACAMYLRRHGVERPALYVQALILTCGEPGCGRRVKARGHCQRHYQRLWKAARREQVA